MSSVEWSHDIRNSSASSSRHLRLASSCAGRVSALVDGIGSAIPFGPGESLAARSLREASTSAVSREAIHQLLRADYGKSEWHRPHYGRRRVRGLTNLGRLRSKVVSGW